MATASTTTSLSSNKNQRILWFFQSNPNDNEKEEWKRYSDFENEFIEEAYQRKDEEVQLNDYVINFKYNLQINKDDQNKQRPVKRELIDVRNYVREERFRYTERPVKSFVDGDNKWESTFINQWLEKNKEIISNPAATAELAAQGIIKEGRVVNQEFDAQRIAEQLRSCTTSQETEECAAQLYSAESFLYKLVNSTLRSEDLTKLDTLGPFCWLLHGYVYSGDDCPTKAVYRGTTLSDEMIEEYKQAQGSCIRWLAFTSTTTDRQVAEAFSGNTLFIIVFNEERGWRIINQSNISSVSHYPCEQEVLLRANFKFRVDKVERDPKNGKYLIYMSEGF